MEKINIAEILKDCPTGMELDCTMIDNVVFEKLDFISSHHPIIIRRTDSNKTIHLTKYGQYSDEEDYKCVIFPKGKTTWEGFHRPFKDGDIVATDTGNWIGITTGGENGKFIPTYCVIRYDGKFEAYLNGKELWGFHRLATEEEKQKLFQAIKDNGYHWNVETKTLEKLIVPKFKVGDKITKRDSIENWIVSSVSSEYYGLKLPKGIESIGVLPVVEQDDWVLVFDIEPKFKVGDRIKYKNGKNINGVEQGVILSLTDDTYDVAVTNDMGIFVPIVEQDDWVLVPNKFDITTLVPFESRVLVRDDEKEKWKPAIWGYYDTDNTKYYPYETICGNCFVFCIPYEGNEHLLGTTNNCDEFYKTW